MLACIKECLGTVIREATFVTLMMLAACIMGVCMGAIATAPATGGVTLGAIAPAIGGCVGVLLGAAAVGLLTACVLECF